MNEYKQPIPDCYHWLCTNNKQFIGYVSAYVRHNYPGYELVRVEDKGRWAVIRKKG